MTPDALTAASFASYPPAAHQFAVEHLQLLRRFPLAVCPSFLQQVKGFDTLFPVEREALRSQFDGLEHLDGQRFAVLIAPLQSLTISDTLRQMDWVTAPDRFVTDFSAFLWSSGQLNTFRKAAQDLFAATPAPADTSSRLIIVVLGQGATVEPARLMRKLRKNGVYLTAFQHASAWDDIAAITAARANAQQQDYAHWYVDGGSPHPVLTSAFQNGVAISYAALDPVRQHVLARMEQAIAGNAGGAEQMRDHLFGTTQADAGVEGVTHDPILQRFYTELFTQSSGPQIFSTSFVQWAGRELARRALPKTLVLRYAPRQQHQDMNAMFAEATPHTLDAQGSLRDAEMGAFYNWIEMSRITAPGKLTFVAWAEGQPYAVVLGPGAPAGTVSGSPITLRQVVQNFS
jgi:hypothetical protein